MLNKANTIFTDRYNPIRNMTLNESLKIKTKEPDQQQQNDIVKSQELVALLVSGQELMRTSDTLVV